MFAPIYETLNTPQIQALLGSPIRLFSFGDAGDGPVAKPYVLWQTISGEPENYLGTRPNVDSLSIQVDVYADSADQAREVTRAVVDRLEAVAYVVAWRGESRDRETRDWRVSFDVDWLVHR